MADENKEVQTTTTEVNPAEQNYIDAIKELKARSVDKSQYDRLLEENKQLLKTLTEGAAPAQEQKPPVAPIDKDKLRQELYGSDNELSNLEYCEKMLQLRKAIMDDGDPDPFVGRGEKLVPDDNDYACAAKVADVLQQCVDYAQGDSEVFTNELQRRTVDVPLPKKHK